jgi:glutaredoxin
MIELYTKSDCTFCTKAKNILESLNVNYTNYLVGKDVTRDYILQKFPEARSYPIVVINGEFIGGYTQLEMRIMENRQDINRMFLTE